MDRSELKKQWTYHAGMNANPAIRRDSPNTRAGARKKA